MRRYTTVNITICYYRAPIFSRLVLRFWFILHNNVRDLVPVIFLTGSQCFIRWRGAYTADTVMIANDI